METITYESNTQLWLFASGTLGFNYMIYVDGRLFKTIENGADFHQKIEKPESSITIELAFDGPGGDSGIYDAALKNWAETQSGTHHTFRIQPTISRTVSSAKSNHPIDPDAIFKLLRKPSTQA